MQGECGESARWISALLAVREGMRPHLTLTRGTASRMFLGMQLIQKTITPPLKNIACIVFGPLHVILMHRKLRLEAFCFVFGVGRGSATTCKGSGELLLAVLA